MAVLQEYDLTNVPAPAMDDAASDSLEVGHLIPGFVVWVYGGTFDAKVQLSADNVEWVDVDDLAAAPLRQQINEPCKYVRVVIDNFSLGTPAATVLGHSSETYS